MGESMVGKCGIDSQQKLIKRGKQLIYLAVVILKVSSFFGAYIEWVGGYHHPATK